jgi:uncharacterized protein YndB with AHSA1/START domain
MKPDRAAAEIRRHLSAAPAKAFAAFADAEIVSRWLTPSPDVRLRVIAFDFREGGHYRFAYHVPDGRIMKVNGIYRLIKEPSDIIFSWNIESPDEHAGVQSEVTVRIAPHGEGCELYIRHERLTADGAAERHREGWRGALEQLDHLLVGRDHIT